MLQGFFDEHGPEKQFYPRYEFSRLGHGYYMGLSIGDFLLAFRNGRLAGVAGVWDQGSFKSYRLLDAPATRAPGGEDGVPAPRNAGSISPFFVHSILVEGNEPAVFADLLSWIMREYADSGRERIALGLDAKDPLLSALEGFTFKRFLSDHFLVTFGKDPRPALKPGVFYLEAARC